MTNQPRESLGDALDRLAAQDPDVAAAAERLDWLAQKVAMGWPEKRVFHPSPADDHERAQPGTDEGDDHGA